MKLASSQPKIHLAKKTRKRAAFIVSQAHKPLREMIMLASRVILVLENEIPGMDAIGEEHLKLARTQRMIHRLAEMRSKRR